MCDGSVGPRADGTPLFGTGVTLHPGHRQRTSTVTGQRLDEIELGAEALRAFEQVEVTDELHDAMLQAFEG